MTIPKITHQIWMQGWDNFPEKFQKNVDSLHEKNPGFQHMKWDETSLRKECLKIGNECAEKFDSLELLICKVDFGRYVVLYNYGGISVDTDMLSLRSINDTPGINESNFIINYESFSYNLVDMKSNAAILCSANSHILMDLIKTIIEDKRKKADFFTKESYVKNITGPSVFNKVVNKYRNDVKILDHKYYEPCFSNDIYCKIPDESIMDHQHEASWINPFYKSLMIFMFFLLHHIVYVTVVIIILIYLVLKYKKMFHFRIFRLLKIKR